MASHKHLVILRACVFGAAAAGLAMLAPAALACGVCIDLPERTASQRLVGDGVVVLARPDPASPFRYAIAEVLRGDPTGLEPPPFLVPSNDRRLMARDPARMAVLSYGPLPASGDLAPSRYGIGASAPPPDGWTRITSGSDTDLEIVREIVARAPAWGAPRDTEGAAPRFDYFAALEGSADAGLRLIALHELTLWPYARLRTMTPATSPEALLSETVNRNRIPEAPILIQLLGLSPAPSAAQIVERGAESAFSAGIASRQAAWGLALVEQTGRDGLDTFVRRVALAPANSIALRREALNALEAIIGSRPALRAAALDAVAQVGTREPALLGEAAAILARSRDWRLAGLADARLGDPRIAPGEAFALRAYVARARTSTD